MTDTQLSRLTWIPEIALGEDEVIRVQFGQSLTLTIMDQIVEVLSMSRWSSNKGASARAGAKHYEQ
jgi:hypothetical protein